MPYVLPITRSLRLRQDCLIIIVWKTGKKEPGARTKLKTLKISGRSGKGTGLPETPTDLTGFKRSGVKGSTSKTQTVGNGLIKRLTMRICRCRVVIFHQLRCWPQHFLMTSGVPSEWRHFQWSVYEFSQRFIACRPDVCHADPFTLCSMPTPCGKIHTDRAADPGTMERQLSGGSTRPATRGSGHGQRAIWKSCTVSLGLVTFKPGEEVPHVNFNASLVIFTRKISTTASTSCRSPGTMASQTSSRWKHDRRAH